MSIAALFMDNPPAPAGTAPAAPALAPSSAEKRDFAMELRNQTAACRVRHEKLGVRKALSREQLRAAAEQFGADVKVLSAAKKLIDTKDPAYRKCVEARRMAGHYWKSVTTPYPEPGIRLIRRTAIAAFNARMTELRAQLQEAAAELQGKYTELRERAQVQLGDLFNEDDYPSRVDTAFELDWDYPTIEPPAYLKNLHPELYERESERMKQRFDEAIRLAEEAFTQQFQQLVSHLAERLKGDGPGGEGKPKVFRDTAVENLKGFFEQFRTLDTGSSPQLRALIDQAQQIVAGVGADDLRASPDLRTKIATDLTVIQQSLDQMMISKPKRAIELEDDAGAGDGDGDGDDAGAGDGDG